MIVSNGPGRSNPQSRITSCMNMLSSVCFHQSTGENPSPVNRSPTSLIVDTIAARGVSIRSMNLPNGPANSNGPGSGSGNCGNCTVSGRGNICSVVRPGVRSGRSFGRFTRSSNGPGAPVVIPARMSPRLGRPGPVVMFARISSRDGTGYLSASYSCMDVISDQLLIGICTVTI